MIFAPIAFQRTIHLPVGTVFEIFYVFSFVAFNSHTGMPYGTVNLRYGVHRHETPITCTAGIGTFLLEFATLSRLTGSPIYERVAMKAMNELWKFRSAINLVIFFNKFQAAAVYV